VVSGFIKAPARLSADRRTRSTETVDIQVQSRVSLCRGTPRIDVQTVVENAAEDHRLRVLFPLGRKAEAGSSEGIFSVDDRPVTPRDKRAYADWVEPPSTNPQKTFVSVCAEARGLTVANRGLPENEVFTDEKGNAVIALTLLRSVGWLSRPDLLARSGNGGWTLPTPGAQCKGRHVFEYSIIPHRGSWEQAGVVALAHQFAFPPLAFAAGAASRAVRAGSLAPYSFVSVDRPEVVLSALKKAEERESCILRVWNASGHAVNAAFAFTEGVKAAYRTSLAEKRGEKLAVKKRVLAVELAPWKIVTLELVFAGNRRTGRVAPPDGTENG
jgi:alpha-mannosidase